MNFSLPFNLFSSKTTVVGSILVPEFLLFIGRYPIFEFPMLSARQPPPNSATSPFSPLPHQPRRPDGFGGHERCPPPRMKAPDAAAGISAFQLPILASELEENWTDTAERNPPSLGHRFKSQEGAGIFSSRPPPTGEVYGGQGVFWHKHGQRRVLN
jgi:hypothetical protein